jgi:hypothetical protein
MGSFSIETLMGYLRVKKYYNVYVSNIMIDDYYFTTFAMQRSFTIIKCDKDDELVLQIIKI